MPTIHIKLLLIVIILLSFDCLRSLSPNSLHEGLDFEIIFFGIDGNEEAFRYALLCTAGAKVFGPEHQMKFFTYNSQSGEFNEGGEHKDSW